MAARGRIVLLAAYVPLGLDGKAPESVAAKEGCRRRRGIVTLGNMMLGNELLVADASFKWGTLVILIPLLFVLFILFRLVRGLFKSREIVGGNALDWIMSIGWLFVFLLGVIGLFLHPLLPVHPWRMLVLRDFLFRYGFFWGFGFVFILLPLRLAVDPVRRKQVLSPERWARLGGKRGAALLLFVAILVVFGWGGGKDVADFFSTPITAVDQPVRYIRGYRTLPAEIRFEESGTLIVPHGMHVAGGGERKYQIEFTPNGRILLSCRAITKPR